MKYKCTEVTRNKIKRAFLELTNVKPANIDLKDTIAFGDGNNDVSMLKLVHCGIAMGNGTEEAKQAADFVTDSIFEDGIYKALIQLNLANLPIP